MKKAESKKEAKKAEPKQEAKKEPKKADEKARRFVRNALEKREEREHRDLDHDGEKGEPAAHRAKVLGYSKEQQMRDNKKGSKK